MRHGWGSTVTCPASFGSLLRHIITVLPLTGLLRRPKLNTWVRSWVRTNTLKINTSANICSLRRRCNLTLVSNVSEAALISACSGSPTDSRNYRNAFLIFFLSFVTWVRTNTLKINTSANICSLRRRCNLTLVSNVSEAALISACSGSPTDSRNYRNAFLIFFLSFVT